LTREEEVKISKRIEKAKQETFDVILNTPLALKSSIASKKSLSTRKSRFRKLLVMMKKFRSG